jgi:hypothetical protein
MHICAFLLRESENAFYNNSSSCFSGSKFVESVIAIGQLSDSAAALAVGQGSGSAVGGTFL